MGLDSSRNQGFCVCCQIHNLFVELTSAYALDSKGFSFHELHRLHREVICLRLVQW